MRCALRPQPHTRSRAVRKAHFSQLMQQRGWRVPNCTTVGTVANSVVLVLCASFSTVGTVADSVVLCASFSTNGAVADSVVLVLCASFSTIGTVADSVVLCASYGS